MSKATERRLHRPNPERVAMLSLGVTILLAVLGQAVWLDGKMERMAARLSAQIESLQAGQAAIRERLAALDARVGSLEVQVGALEVRFGAIGRARYCDDYAVSFGIVISAGALA